MDAALRAALAAQLATVSGLPTVVAGENTSTEPLLSATHLRTQLVFGRRDRLTAPANGAWVIEEGLFLVDLFAPMGEGPDAADTLARAILTAFPDGLTLIADAGQTVRCTGSRRSGGVRGDAWYQVPCEVRWRREHQQTV